jgi:hypothetical protein
MFNNALPNSQKDLLMSFVSVNGIIPCMLRKLLGTCNVKALNCVDKMHFYLDFKK